MSQLVSRLVEQRCPVSVPCGAASASAAWTQYLADGVLPVTIALTRGSTELDVGIEPGQAVEQVQTNVVRVQGHLILDDVPLRAIVELDLETLRGFAQLQAGSLG
ncbi:MAG TPA: hypothetical protein VE377_19040 [Candidatus Dormibacteraeota bacterium]|nr:hypothetical protein [Candidatus Dormibacteraeota bacterium]